MVKAGHWGYLRGVRAETILLFFGLTIGVLLWYGVSRVPLADHAGRSQRDPRHQTKGKT
jgi:hypothetical protein